MYVTNKITNIISMTRGDTVDIPIDLTFGEFPLEEEWIMEPGDVVIFYLMYPNQPFEDAVVKKIVEYNDLTSEGKVVIHLDIKDTIDLIPGNYYYCVKALYTEEDDTSEGGTIKNDTLIQNTRFNILG